MKRCSVVDSVFAFVVLSVFLFLSVFVFISVFVILSVSVFVFPFAFECWFLQIGLDLHVGPASGLVVASVLCGGKVIID